MGFKIITTHLVMLEEAFKQPLGTRRGGVDVKRPAWRVAGFLVKHGVSYGGFRRGA